jgi:hypothetical protein
VGVVHLYLAHSHGLGCKHCVEKWGLVHNAAFDGRHLDPGMDGGGDAALPETPSMLPEFLSRNLAVHRSNRCYHMTSSQRVVENFEVGTGDSTQAEVAEALRPAKNFLDRTRNVHCRTHKGKMAGGLLANSRVGAGAGLSTWVSQVAWCFFLRIACSRTMSS